MGRTSRSARPPALRAGTLWARVVFDGTTVCVTRRFDPVPGRRTRRYPVDDVLAAHFAWLGGEDESRRFDMAVRGGPTVRVGVHLGLRGRDGGKAGRWAELIATLNAAVARRMHCVLHPTVGRASWSETVWQRVEALVPELTCFAYTDYRSDGQHREIGHRQAIEDGVLASLARRDSERPRSGSVLPGLTYHPWDRPTGHEMARRRAEAWHDLIDALREELEPGFSAQWTADEAPALLARGHFHPGRRTGRPTFR